jgi:hypothetical protein
MHFLSGFFRLILPRRLPQPIRYRFCRAIRYKIIGLTAAAANKYAKSINIRIASLYKGNNVAMIFLFFGCVKQSIAKPQGMKIDTPDKKHRYCPTPLNQCSAKSR